MHSPALPSLPPRAAWPALRCGAVSGRRRGAVQEPEPEPEPDRERGRGRARAAPPLRWRLAERGGGISSSRLRPAGLAAPPSLFSPSLPPPARVPRVQHEVQRWPGEVRRR